MQLRIEELTQQYIRLWHETPVTLPDLGVVYSCDQKRELAREAALQLDRLEISRQQGARDREKVQNALEESRAELEGLCDRAGLYFDRAFTDGFGQATREFLSRIKAFDPELPPENIWQAMRNLWIINSLQVMMGKPMACPAPSFAYSMLYPYSDNVIDDPELCLTEKWATNDRFRRWLEGEEVLPLTATEEKIRALVQIIEAGFSRQACPGLFQSLLGIFNAQIKSILQQKQHRSGREADLLGISVEKGGSSVLADGYLIQGALDAAWEDFTFGYGVFLQFADDLQDLDEDLKNGHQTLFTRAAENGPLDGLANRLFHFMTRVIDLHLTAPAQQRCRALIHKNCFFMVQEAICKTAAHYSPAYIRTIERHFPLSLPYYRQVKLRLKKMLLETERSAGALVMA
ncbi:MAG TPA: hypothetical protein PKJ13_03260 [bacterium]|nr:hypothetical protein [bacterium]HOY45863.1 hypothetical protein [bacterium]HPG84142.1 hypothetical protein [bacterium]